MSLIDNFASLVSLSLSLYDFKIKEEERKILDSRRGVGNFTGIPFQWSAPVTILSTFNFFFSPPPSGNYSVRAWCTAKKPREGKPRRRLSLLPYFNCPPLSVFPLVSLPLSRARFSTSFAFSARSDEFFHQITHF